MIDVEIIKDALIHFEKSHKIALEGPTLWGMNTNSDSPTSVGITINVLVNRLYTRQILSFVEWNWVNTNLKTALDRMNQEGVNKEIKMDCNKIIISLKEELCILKNLHSLSKIIKEFNVKTLGGVIRMRYDDKINKVKINLYKESNKDIEPMFSVLSDNFIITDLRKDGVIINRFGLPSGNQNTGIIANLEPKNFEIYE